MVKLADLTPEDRAELVREALGAPLMKLSEVAAHLGVNVKGLREACRRGRVPHMRWNEITTGSSNEYRFSAEQVREIQGMMTVDVDVEGEA